MSHFVVCASLTVQNILGNSTYSKHIKRCVEKRRVLGGNEKLIVPADLPYKLYDIINKYQLESTKDAECQKVFKELQNTIWDNR